MNSSTFKKTILREWLSQNVNMKWSFGLEIRLSSQLNSLQRTSGTRMTSHLSSTWGSEGAFFSFKAKTFQHLKWQFWKNCQQAPADMNTILQYLHLSFLFIKKQNRNTKTFSQDCVFSYKKMKYFLPDGTEKGNFLKYDFRQRTQNLFCFKEENISCHYMPTSSSLVSLIWLVQVSTTKHSPSDKQNANKFWMRKD